MDAKNNAGKNQIAPILDPTSIFENEVFVPEAKKERNMSVYIISVIPDKEKSCAKTMRFMISVIMTAKHVTK